MKPIHLYRYRLRLRPLSPIHIGSGQTIDPCEFVPHEQDDGRFLIVVDLPRLLADLSAAQREEYDRIVTRGDFPSLRNWLGKAAAASSHRRFKVQVQAEAYDQIVNNLDNPQRLGEIHLFTRDAASGRPYFPGSSIKGAIRTAIIDHLAQHDTQRRPQLAAMAAEAGRPNAPRNLGVRFEATVMGNLNAGNADLYRDPLRQLSVSDLPMPPDACCIDRIQIVRPKDQPPPRAGGADPSGIVIYREITWSILDEISIEFAGEARLAPLLSERSVMRQNVLPQSLDIGRICQWCNDFYRPRLKEETDRFVADAATAEKLRKATQALGSAECLIRVGHHSHFECVTVGEPFRQPPKRGFGKTRSYASGMLPLGWAILRFDPWDQSGQQE